MLFGIAAKHEIDCVEKRPEGTVLCEECVSILNKHNCKKFRIITPLTLRPGDALLLNADNMCQGFRDKRFISRLKWCGAVVENFLCDMMQALITKRRG